MDNYEKILKIVRKNNGYITSAQLRNENIKVQYLTNLVKKGSLVKLSKGYYGTPNYIADEFYRIQSFSERAIYSLDTALYLHNLSDRTPLIYTLSTVYGYSGQLLTENNVALNFISSQVLDLGVIEMKSPFGMKIKVYDKERTICDIIKYKNKMDAEIYSKALKNYAADKNKDLNLLMKYANKLNIKKKVREYMEVLL